MNTEHIGMAILAVSILILAAQTAFAYGRKVGANNERLLADRRVNGVLAYERNRKPKSQRAKRKQSRRASLTRIGTITLP